MNLLQLLTYRLRSAMRLSQAAEKIADQSFETAWQRVEGRIPALNSVETRGYIRARAGAVIQQQIEMMVQRGEVAASAKPRLYALAMEALIRRLTTHSQAIAARNATGHAA